MDNATPPEKIDRDNFDDKLISYLPYILEIFRRNRFPEPEDAVHDVWLSMREKVVVKGEAIDWPRTFLPLVCRSYMAHYFDRSVNKRKLLLEHVEIPTEMPKYDLRIDLEKALAQLEKRDRDLVESAEESRDALAAEFNTSVLGVTQRLKRARENLAEGMSYSRRKKKHNEEDRN